MGDKPKVKIKVKAFVADVRDGFDDRTLIEKYNLSEKMLPKVFDQMVSAGHLTDEELTNRCVFESTQDVMELFSFSFDSDKGK